MALRDMNDPTNKRFVGAPDGRAERLTQANAANRQRINQLRAAGSLPSPNTSPLGPPPTTSSTTTSRVPASVSTPRNNNVLKPLRSNAAFLANSRVGRGAASLGRVGSALAAAGAVGDSLAEDSTDRYAKRFGVSAPTGDGSLKDIAKFTALRAGGFASDLGNRLTFGLAGRAFRDQPGAAPTAPNRPASATRDAAPTAPAGAGSVPVAPAAAVAPAYNPEKGYTIDSETANADGTTTSNVRDFRGQPGTVAMGGQPLSQRQGRGGFAIGDSEAFRRNTAGLGQGGSNLRRVIGLTGQESVQEVAPRDPAREALLEGDQRAIFLRNQIAEESLRNPQNRNQRRLQTLADELKGVEAEQASRREVQAAQDIEGLRGRSALDVQALQNEGAMAAAERTARSNGLRDMLDIAKFDAEQRQRGVENTRAASVERDRQIEAELPTTGVPDDVAERNAALRPQVRSLDSSLETAPPEVQAFFRGPGGTSRLSRLAELTSALDLQAGDNDSFFSADPLTGERDVNQILKDLAAFQQSVEQSPTKNRGVYRGVEINLGTSGLGNMLDSLFDEINRSQVDALRRSDGPVYSALRGR